MQPYISLCREQNIAEVCEIFFKLTAKTVLQYFCFLGAAKVLQSLGSAILFLPKFHQFHVIFFFLSKQHSNTFACSQSWEATGYDLANLGSHFIPRGFAPWMKCLPRVAKSIASRFVNAQNYSVMCLILKEKEVKENDLLKKMFTSKMKDDGCLGGIREEKFLGAGYRSRKSAAY